MFVIYPFLPFIEQTFMSMSFVLSPIQGIGNRNMAEIKRKGIKELTKY